MEPPPQKIAGITAAIGIKWCWSRTTPVLTAEQTGQVLSRQQSGQSRVAVRL